MTVIHQYKLLFHEAFSNISRDEKRKLKYLTLGQLFSSVLDLVAVGLIGLTAALAASGVTIQNPSQTLFKITSALKINEYSIQNQVAFLAIMAVLLFMLRTMLSIYITKKSIKVLFGFGAKHADMLFGRFLNSTYETSKKIDVNQIRYALTRGSQSLYVGFVGGFLALLGDLSIVFILSCALVLIDTKTAIASLVFFGGIGIFLHFQTHSKIVKFAQRETEIDIQTGQAISDLVLNYKFLIPRGGLPQMREQLAKQRMKLTDYVAELTFLPSFSKYYIESALIVGAVFLTAFQFLTKDSGAAITSVGIFLAAGTRISPAVLRVQQSLMAISRSISTAFTTINLKSQLVQKGTSHNGTSRVPEELTASIEFKDVSYKFDDEEEFLFNDVSFRISPGEHIAITGESGAGKTTLLNLLLGISAPTSGLVLLSGVNPEKAFEIWRGKIAYVPQETILINGSIRENLLFGIEDLDLSDQQLLGALYKANLGTFVQGLPQKLDYQVGELGSSLSGGQRQRLALARALVTEPKVLILDEATSSVDAKTEENISNELIKLKDSITIVSIAHKKESVDIANRVLCLKDGRLICIRCS